MKKKKRIITTLGLLLVVVIGATFAYYTSNTSFENVFNAGKYKITLTEEFVSPDNWVPGETIPKTVTAKNDGTVDAAVRISYTEQWTKEIDGVETDITSQVSPNPAIINFDNTDDWTLSNGKYYYKYILKPTDETSSFISGVTLDPNLNSVTCTGEGNTKTCEARNEASGAKYKLTFTIETIQYDVYENEWNTNVEITEKVVLNIGDPVNYSTSLNGVTLDDWKVFYIDGDSTYLILSGYLPNSAVNLDNLLYIYNYGFVEQGCRNNMLNAMSNKANWDELVTNGMINGSSLNLSVSENVWAMGSPTLELWIDSWNSNANYSTLYSRYENPATTTGITNDGYFVGLVENPTTTYLNLSSLIDEDNLYFPSKSDINVRGYWLSSPSAASMGNAISCSVVVVYSSREVSSCLAYDQVEGFRPIISLPTSVFNQ